MTKIYEGNFRVFLELFKRMQRALKEQGLPYMPEDGGSIDKTMKAISALHNIKRVPSSTNVPISPHFQVNHQWIDAALEELYSFNAMGDEYICSTVEAVIKCNGIKKLYDNYSSPLFFRGEHNFGWDLKSRVGRKLEIDWSSTYPYNVTSEEKRLLREFQDRCKTDKVTRTTVFGGEAELLPIDHSGWWSLMQHYDDNYGTRMIDITTSLYCALFFASADWDGTVDSSVDGKLYMFPHQPGRGETDFPDRHRGQLIGSEDERQHTVDDYFRIENNLDFPRFKVSPTRNDRALSQDGYFVWQPYFDKPLYTFQIFPFRIHRDFKLSILKELASMGYTRDRVLANNRFGSQAAIH